MVHLWIVISVTDTILQVEHLMLIHWVFYWFYLCHIWKSYLKTNKKASRSLRSMHTSLFQASQKDQFTSDQPCEHVTRIKISNSGRPSPFFVLLPLHSQGTYGKQGNLTFCFQQKTWQSVPWNKILKGVLITYMLQVLKWLTRQGLRRLSLQL